MSREDALFLKDIQQSCERILEFSAGFSKEAFFADPKTSQAVFHNLMIIGEAVKRLSPSLKDKYPEVDWRKIAGLRDVIAHEYFGLDVHIIWDVIAHEIPALHRQIKGLSRGGLPRADA